MKNFIVALLFLFSSSAHALIADQKQILVAQSMGASFNSTAVDVVPSDLASIQIVWTGGGAPAGSFKLQVSNDDVALCSSVTNWSDYTGSTIAIAGDGDLAYNVANLGYRCMRVAYTRTGGTGTANANLVMKYEARR